MSTMAGWQPTTKLLFSPHKLQDHPVDLGRGGVMRLVQDDEASPAQGEHETEKKEF